MRIQSKVTTVLVAGALLFASTTSTASAAITQKALLTFTAKTVEGEPFSSKVLTGKKPSVLWFWAPWCAICHNESVNLVKAEAQYGDRVNFIGVGALGNSEEMRTFVAETGVDSFTNLDDSSGKVWKRFGVVLQPTLIFISSKGKISTHIGPSDSDFLNSKVKALAASK